MSGFEDSQRNYYSREINRALPVSAQVADASVIQTALGIPSTESSGTVRDVASLMSSFGRDAGAVQRDEACRQLIAPSASMRSPDSRTGCGWWFTPNPSQQSGGAYGTRRGPMSPNLDSVYGTGQWVWDPAQAQQLEGMKQAAKVQSCPDLQFSRYPNVGWCPSTNMAVVTDGNGNPAFAQYPGGDCPGGGIIMSANNCPPPPPPASTQSGVPVPTSGGISDICQPGSNGALSPACLQSINNLACTTSGTLSVALGGGYAGGSGDFQNVNAVLLQRGFSIPSGIINDGQISVQSAINASYALRTAANAGDGSRGTLAAQNMCLGTPFDPCSFAGSDVGPYPQSCIEQAAIAKGFSPNGAIMPANGGMGFWNGIANWAGVLQMMDVWKNAANVFDPNNPNLQTLAIKNVFGMGVQLPKQGCNVHGLLMYRYFFPTWDQSLFTPSGPQTHFLGRYIFKQGFPYKPSTFEDQTPAGGYLTEGQRYVCNFIPIVGGTYQFLIGHDDGVRLSINDQVFMDWAGCCGNNATNTINMIAGQPYKLAIDLWNGGGPWTFTFQTSVDGGPWTNLPLTQLYMTQDRRLPTFELAFNKMPMGSGNGPITDTNIVFQNLAMGNATIGSYNGKQCMIVKGNGSGVYNVQGSSKIVQGARVRAFKSYTMMVQIDSVKWGSGATPSIFTLYNLPGSNVTAYPRTAVPESWDFPNQTQQFMITASSTNIYPWGKGTYSASNMPVDYMFGQNAGINSAYPPGQWFHFAMVWDDDFTGYVTYINGKPSQHFAAVPYDVQTIMEQMRIGSDATDDGAGWTGGMAWFRAFDYRLSQDLINRDMNDDWANLY